MSKPLITVKIHNSVIRIQTDNQELVRGVFNVLFEKYSVPDPDTGARKYAAVFFRNGHIIVVPSVATRRSVPEMLRDYYMNTPEFKKKYPWGPPKDIAVTLSQVIRVEDHTNPFRPSTGVRALRLLRDFKNEAQQKTFHALTELSRSFNEFPPYYGKMLLKARTSSGKTYMAVRLIVASRARTLAIFPTRALMKNFVDEIFKSSDITEEEICYITTDMVKQKKLPVGKIIYYMGRQTIHNILKDSVLAKRLESFCEDQDFQLRIMDEVHKFFENTLMVEMWLINFPRTLEMTATPKRSFTDRVLFSQIFPDDIHVGGDEYENYHIIYDVSFGVDDLVRANRDKAARSWDWAERRVSGEAKHWHFGGFPRQRPIQMAKQLLQYHEGFLRMAMDHLDLMKSKYKAHAKTCMFACTLKEEVFTYQKWIWKNRPDLKAGIVYGDTPVDDRDGIFRDSDIVFATNQSVGYGVDYYFGYLICPIPYTGGAELEQTTGRLRIPKIPGDPRVAVYYSYQSLFDRFNYRSKRDAAFKKIAMEYHVVERKEFEELLMKGRNWHEKLQREHFDGED